VTKEAMVRIRKLIAGWISYARTERRTIIDITITLSEVQIPTTIPLVLSVSSSPR
jgi:hypothetical protein